LDRCAQATEDTAMVDDAPNDASLQVNALYCGPGWT
jgi:hypothetical protein